jgi:hypothetical protein
MSRIVAVGTSSGGLEALRGLLGTLPVEFPAPVCIVMHTGAESPGILPAILNRSTPLEVRYDRHLLVEPGRVRVQDPADALFPEMPQSAIDRVAVDHIVPLAEMGSLYSIDSLVAAVSEGVDESLWNAMRSLDEAGLLLQAVAHLQRKHGVDARQMARAGRRSAVARGRDPGADRPPQAADNETADQRQLGASILGDDRSQPGLPHPAPPPAVRDERSTRHDRVGQVLDRQRNIFARRGGVDEERLRGRQPQVSAVRRYEPLHQKDSTPFVPPGQRVSARGGACASAADTGMCRSRPRTRSRPIAPGDVR